MNRPTKLTHPVFAGVMASVLLAFNSAARGPDETPAAFVARLEHDAVVELLGITRLDAGENLWWRADGSRCDAIIDGPESIIAKVSHLAIVRITSTLPDEPSWRLGVIGAGGGFTSRRSDSRHDCFQVGFTPVDPGQPVDLRVTIAAGEWQVAATIEGPHGMAVRKLGDGQIAIGEAIDVEDGCRVTTSDDRLDHEIRFVAVGHDGSRHAGQFSTSGMSDAFRQSNVEFPLSAQEMHQIEIQLRPYDQFALFKNIALAPGKDAGFKLQSGPVPK